MAEELVEEEYLIKLYDDLYELKPSKDHVWVRVGDIDVHIKVEDGTLLVGLHDKDDGSSPFQSMQLNLEEED